MKRPLIMLLFFGGWVAAVLLVGGLMGLGAEVLGMTNRTYHYVLGAIIAVSVIVWLRNRWRESVHHYRTHVAPQNELDCLEEMANDYRSGKYHNREYIERVIRDIEVNYEPSRLRDRYLEDARDALEEGRLLRRPGDEDFQAVIVDPMNQDKSDAELHRLAIARKMRRSGHVVDIKDLT